MREPILYLKWSCVKKNPQIEFEDLSPISVGVVADIFLALEHTY